MYPGAWARAPVPNSTEQAPNSTEQHRTARWLFCGCSAGLRGLLFVAGWGVAMDSDDDLTVPAPLQRGRGPASIVDASTIVKPALEAIQRDWLSGCVRIPSKVGGGPLG